MAPSLDFKLSYDLSGLGAFLGGGPVGGVAPDRGPLPPHPEQHRRVQDLRPRRRQESISCLSKSGESSSCSTKMREGSRCRNKLCVISGCGTKLCEDRSSGRTFRGAVQFCASTAAFPCTRSSRAPFEVQQLHIFILCIKFSFVPTGWALS